MDGTHSTLTDDRMAALNQLGFVWDSHVAGWQSSYQDLIQYKEVYGHTNVPSKCPKHPKLAVWVK